MKHRRSSGVGLMLLAAWVWQGCAETEIPSPAKTPSATRIESAVDAPTPRPPLADDWFEEVTSQTGVKSIYRSGRDAGFYSILETVGGGVAVFDYDQDGDMDLFFPAGGQMQNGPPAVRGLPGTLYRNEGDWSFRDVTRDAGLEEPGDYSHGCAVSDFNRDGWPDLFVTCYGQSRLYRNENGKRFSDVTHVAGLADSSWSTAAAWGDVNRDGWPDLYVASYLNWRLDPQDVCEDPGEKTRDVCPPQKYPAAMDRLFLNHQGMRFEDVTEQAQLSREGKGLGVVAADLNRDGWLDFYVANDAVANQMYLGGPTFPFRDAAPTSGTALNEFGAPEGSMGVDFSDYNGDGRGDLFLTNFEMEDNSLYRHLDRDVFVHATVVAGLGGRSRTFVGFGTGFADFDGDGWQDLYVINGHVFYHRGRSPFRQPAFLLRNDQGNSFQDVSARGGPWFSVPHPGRGAAVGDLDNDGALDLVIVNQDAPAAILRNRRRPANWIRLRLRGTRSDPFAVGASLSLENRGRTLVRFVRGGGGYLSHSDRRILLPVPDGHETVQVTVRWPSGREEHFKDLTPRQTNDLVEGTGTRDE